MSTLAYEDWQDTWEKLFEKLEEEGYDQLTPDERLWYNVRGVIDSWGDGGLISFYYNHWADTWEDTLTDLEKLNQPQAASLLKRINLLFPDGRPSDDIEERNDVIDTWDDEHDELFEELDAKFGELEGGLEEALEPVIHRVIDSSTT